MNNIGQLCTWIALIAAGISASGYLVLCVEEDNTFARNMARLSFAAFTALPMAPFSPSTAMW